MSTLAGISMTSRGPKCLFIAVLILGMLPVTAEPTPVIDQQQATIDMTVGALAIGGFSEQKLAQTITAGLSGALTEVRFPVVCNTGNLLVEVQGVTANGVPNGTTLASRVITGSSLPTFPSAGVTFRSIPFASPVIITSGSRFAVLLTSTGSCAVYQGPLGNSYAGGNAYFDARPNPAGVWVCICEFSGGHFDLPFQTIVNLVIVVVIDIRPGGGVPNPINTRSHGLIPVAILSSSTFEAPAVVNKSSVKFGRTGSEASLAFCNASGEDVNFDGRLDLVCHFFNQETAFQSGDTIGILTGQTLSGVAFRGTDSVRIVR